MRGLSLRRPRMKIFWTNMLVISMIMIQLMWLWKAKWSVTRKMIYFVPFLWECLKSSQPEKKFTCEKCSYETNLKANLKGHINRVHKKLRNFKCEECSFTCSVKCNLDIHIKAKHRNIRDWNCAECSYRHFNSVTGRVFSSYFSIRIFRIYQRSFWRGRKERCCIVWRAEGWTPRRKANRSERKRRRS